MAFGVARCKNVDMRKPLKYETRRQLYAITVVFDRIMKLVIQFLH